MHKRETTSRKRLHRRRLYQESLEARHMLAADVVGLIPADDSTNVPVDTNLVATFSDPIQLGPGTGNIELHNIDDNSLIEAINVRSDRVTIDGATLTIDPTQNLPANTNVSVRPAVAKVRDFGTEVANTTIFAEDFESLPLKESQLAGLDDFVVVLSGVLDVQTAGDYTFGSTSDDGQLLAIDIDQNGLDPFSDDQIIFDDTTHGNQDRLHTCGPTNAAQSCVDAGEVDAINLAVGQYPFEYWFFDAGGGHGGEVWYAPGYHEIFGDNFARGRR